MLTMVAAAQGSLLQLQHDVHYCKCSTMFIIASVARCSLLKVQNDALLLLMQNDVHYCRNTMLTNASAARCSLLQA